MGGGQGLLLRGTVLPQRAWVLWAPRRGAGHRSGKERVPEYIGDWEGGLGLVLRGRVLLWRGWVLWAPCPPVGPGAGEHGASEGVGLRLCW